MSIINMIRGGAVLFLLCPILVFAKIDLVTMPSRDNVQLTIYNDENITMVRDQRTLTLSKGVNELEFGWANTLIDPTSVSLTAPKHKDQVRLVEVKYPPNSKGSAIWVLDSEVAGAIPVNIQFFTANIEWQAVYTAVLNQDEERMQLASYIRVNNNSGEDYLNAETRVIVGNLNLVDSIPDLANRHDPYGRPVAMPAPMVRAEKMQRMSRLAAMAEPEMLMDTAGTAAKRIVKTALSEFFVYSIDGTEDLLNGWGKRLPSLDVDDVPVQSLFRYDEDRYGRSAHKLILLSNNKQHKLGDEPLPNGQVVVYRRNDKGPDSIVGKTQTKYIPIGSDAEFDFGPSSKVLVTPTLMSSTTASHQFDKSSEVKGYDVIQEWQIEVENYQTQRADIEIERRLNSSHWKLVNKSAKNVKFEQLDHDSIQYKLSLASQGKKTFSYVVTYGEGSRQNVYAK